MAVALAVPRVTRSDSASAPMMAVKVSTFSTSSSDVVRTCSVADVLPAAIVTLVAACAV